MLLYQLCAALTLLMKVLLLLVSVGSLDCESLDCTFTVPSGGVSTGSVRCAAT